MDSLTSPVSPTKPLGALTAMVLLDTASPRGGAFIFDFEPSGINNGGQLALTASLTTVGVRRLWRRGQVSAPTGPRLDKRVLRPSPTHTALPVRFAAGAFSSSPTRTWRGLPRAHPRSSGRSISRTRHAPCPLHVSRCPVSMVRLSRRSPAAISPARTCGGRKFRWHGLRIVDIADPHAPREVASFVPPVPEGETRVCSNDACVDARGLLYLIDRGRGLHILERGEHRRRPSRVAAPAAGRHP
jgi:hypothetical protein